MNKTTDTHKPKLSLRCTWVFGWFIPIYILFSYFNYREGIPLDTRMLAVFSLIGMGLAVPSFLQVIRLKKKTESKIQAILQALFWVIVLIFLLELKRRGIFVWNELYFTVPMVLFSVVIYSGCFFAEDRNYVRVYLALDGFHYVQA